MGARARGCPRCDRRALYHPPKPIYQTSEFLNHIEVCLDAVESAFPAALVILAGDFNILPEEDVARSALCTVVDQPTRGTTLGSTVRGAHKLWPSIMQYVLAARETVVISRTG